MKILLKKYNIINYFNNLKNSMAKGTVNKVILIGRLGFNPEISYTSDGKTIATLSLATNSKYKNKNTKEFVETTEWHRVILFNKSAEIAKQFLSKGKRVYIEGSIKTRTWKDQNDQKRYTVEIIASTFQILDNFSKSFENKEHNSFLNKNIETLKDSKKNFEEDDIPF